MECTPRVGEDARLAAVPGEDGVRPRAVGAHEHGPVGGRRHLWREPIPCNAQRVSAPSRQPGPRPAAYIGKAPVVEPVLAKGALEHGVQRLVRAVAAAVAALVVVVVQVGRVLGLLGRQQRALERCFACASKRPRSGAQNPALARYALLKQTHGGTWRCRSRR